ncbi:MAG: HK97-gp10 family putative phage morphogenesis protein [Gammaproteobacteria bacterium]
MSSEGLEGLADVEKVLKELPGRIAKGAVRRVLRKAAQPIRDRWAELAHVLTGRLRGSIAISARQKSGRQMFRTREEANEAVIYVGPTADGYPQAIMEEFGTIHAPAHPSGRPAWEAEQDNALAIAARELGPEVAKAAARLAKRTSRR